MVLSLASMIYVWTNGWWHSSTFFPTLISLPRPHCQITESSNQPSIERGLPCQAIFIHPSHFESQTSKNTTSIYSIIDDARIPSHHCTIFVTLYISRRFFHCNCSNVMYSTRWYKLKPYHENLYGITVIKVLTNLCSVVFDSGGITSLIDLSGAIRCLLPAAMRSADLRGPFAAVRVPLIRLGCSSSRRSLLPRRPTLPPPPLPGSRNSRAVRQLSEGTVQVFTCFTHNRSIDLKNPCCPLILQKLPHQDRVVCR